MSLLKLEKLTKYFGGLRAVNELDLSVERGEIVGLIGPNGAGKTTVFNTITGSFHPTTGKIFFAGKNITGLNPHTIAGLGLARSFQQTQLFSEMTVLDNILVGFHLRSRIGFWSGLVGTPSSRHQEKQMVEKAIEIIQFLELAHVKYELAKNLPHGYQRLLGVGIALATGPELLLMDEPSTGMNQGETERLLGIIKEMNNRGLTIFLVAHNVRLIMNVCERVTVLNFGSKIAEGTPGEISSNSEVINAYLGSGYASRC
jgi:branched-chain amino acid transport system ATP-binding protein